MGVRLADLKTGEKAKILGFYPVDLRYQQRFLSMGLVPGTEFMVSRVAPLGDPIEIKLHQISLCIRKQEGSVLRLERVKSS